MLVVVHSDCQVETIVPEKTPRKDQSRRREGVRVVDFMSEERVLSVENSIIESCSSVEIKKNMTQEL